MVRMFVESWFIYILQSIDYCSFRYLEVNYRFLATTIKLEIKRQFMAVRKFYSLSTRMRVILCYTRAGLPTDTDCLGWRRKPYKI